MDPILSSLLFAAAGFVVRHLLQGTSVFPTTFGHGELIKWLLQSFANQSPTPVQPTTPNVDFNAFLKQLLALLEKTTVSPTTPSLPVVPK